MTESRVSQLHTKAILRLKARLAGAAAAARRRRRRSGLRSRRDTIAPSSTEESSPHACSSPERSATSPSSATEGPGRRRSSRRCSSSPARSTGSARSRPGTTVSDWDEDEQRRQMSLSATLAHAEWQGRKINLIDTPGDAGFQGDAIAALRVVEGALVVVSARDGRRGRHRAAPGTAREDGRPRARRLREHARPRARRLLPRARGAPRAALRRAASPCTSRSAPSTS